MRGRLGRVAHLHGPRGRFVGVFSATLAAFLAIGAVLPVLPRYVVDELGGGDLDVGIVVGAFAFSAVVSRPLAGRLADAHGRRRIVVLGAVTMAAAGLLYPLSGSVAALVLARLVLGFGDGFVFTGGSAWPIVMPRRAPAAPR